MISDRQIELVQDSFAQVLPIAATVASDFYRRLFALAPDTRALFRGDMDDQGRKLFLTLATVVDALNALERVVPAAEALAVRHVGYGVQDRHYEVVGVALVEALGDALGHRFDEETAAAWTTAYGILSDCMRAAASAACEPVHG